MKTKENLIEERGCEKCNPHWSLKITKLEIAQQKLNDWKKRFDEDIERRSKILFSRD